jgi:hypothetical protein
LNSAWVATPQSFPGFDVSDHSQDSKAWMLNELAKLMESQSVACGNSAEAEREPNCRCVRTTDSIQPVCSNIHELKARECAGNNPLAEAPYQGISAESLKAMNNRHILLDTKMYQLLAFINQITDLENAPSNVPIASSASTLDTCVAETELLAPDEHPDKIPDLLRVLKELCSGKIAPLVALASCRTVLPRTPPSRKNETYTRSSDRILKTKAHCQHRELADYHTAMKGPSGAHD